MNPQSPGLARVLEKHDQDIATLRASWNDRKASQKAPRLGSYTDATGSTTVACGCRIDTLPTCVVASPCQAHRAVMVVEMRHREPA